MAMVSGWLALAILAADGPSCSPDETTTFQVRVLCLDGLDWRTSAYSRLTPVTRQGTSAIWTADKALAAVLAERASSVTQSGKILATGETSLFRSNDVNYVAAMERVADGPINQSTAIAFMPRPETVEERLAVKLAGRSLDQGVLTRVTLDETHVDALHSVTQTESLRATATRTGWSTSEAGRNLAPTGVSRTSTESPTTITASVQIPEVSQTRIDGEWLIPRDGVLIISLGVKTTADDKGKAIVRERVAVIEAMTPDRMTPPLTPVPLSKMTMPPTPMRSYPQSVDASGAVTDLPPLPEAVASADLDRIKPDPSKPSPQTAIPVEPADAAIARTSYDAAPPAPNPPLVDAVETTPEARVARLKELTEALAKAGFDLDIDVYRTSTKTDSQPAPVSVPICDKCDGESLFCPAEARAVKAATVPGAMKLAAEKAAMLGVTIKDAQGFQSLDSSVKLDEAFKNPGKTETTVLPLGEQFSLEIKATVVPTAKATARKTPFSAPSPK